MTDLPEKLYAWMTTDQDGTQGIVSRSSRNGDRIYLISDDEESLEMMSDDMTELAKITKTKISLVEFSFSKLLKVIDKRET